MVLNLPLKGFCAVDLIAFDFYDNFDIHRYRQAVVDYNEIYMSVTIVFITQYGSFVKLYDEIDISTLLSCEKVAVNWCKTHPLRNLSQLITCDLNLDYQMLND